MRIALDAMGSDRAPAVEVEAAVAAVRAGHQVLLVGDRSRLEPLLPAAGAGLELVHAPGVVTPAESPVAAVRRHRDSSLRRCFDLARQGAAAAVVSAGDSGAIMATALMTMGKIEGIERAPIASVFPTLHGSAVLLDMGANVDCRPSHLQHFALLGSVYARQVLGLERVRVGLLSNGTESRKGNELTRQADALLREMPLDYVGYVEGRDVLTGRVDVVVCDGFVGNVMLKSMEGAAQAFLRWTRDEIDRTWLSRFAGWLLRPTLRRLRERLDYAEVGGAPLLGVRGSVIICHGASTPRAIENAVAAAAKMAAGGVVAAVTREIEGLSPQEMTRRG